MPSSPHDYIPAIDRRGRRRQDRQRVRLPAHQNGPSCDRRRPPRLPAPAPAPPGPRHRLAGRPAGRDLRHRQPRAGTAYDLAVVPTPGHQAGPLLPALKRSDTKCVHFMFVTFDAERLRHEMGDHPCTFGMPAINAPLDDDGRLKMSIGRQKTLHGDRRWAELFNHAGIPSALEPNMPLWLRCHAPMTAAMESTAIAKQRSGAGGFRQRSRTAARGMRAGFTIIEALGDRPYPRSKAMIRRAPQPLLAFILRASARFFPGDLTGAATESRQLIDVIAGAAEGRPNLAKPAQAVLAMRP